MSTNLAQQLREKTTKSHSMAENVSFVKSFLGGVVDKKSYRQLIANLYFIYEAIEEEIEQNKKNFAVSAIYFPQLYRKESLASDLNYYYGDNWLNEIEPSAATQIYVDRIHNIGYSNPELLISHSYTRYIGDLSGGQILKKIAQNAMQLNDNQGISFYDFDLIDNEKVFKNLYRQSLNNIPLNKKQIEQIIAEANIAFTLNMKIFQELNSNLIKIMVMFLISSVNNLSKKFL
uniref:Heme oxygenase n=1 Tax=Pleurostichidium falkenbergii TaxID=121064 RepID=A0A4D6UYS5_9FLOR|nr:Heme oxygenase [Pleurostichidium falkenbergii]QCH39674.1 Heme oxygenase [Pleurostichidium falkenbergii]